METHSLAARIVANVVDVASVHGDAHIIDEYVIRLPDGYTAEIEGAAWQKSVFEAGYIASADVRDQPREGAMPSNFQVQTHAPAHFVTMIT